MKRTLEALLVLIVLVALPLAPAYGELGHKMAEDSHTPQTLALAIEEALQEDATGRSAVIRGTACSTPHHYMEAFEETFDDLRFGGDYEQLLRFLRSLRRVENVAERHLDVYGMSRTLGKRDGPCELDLAGYSRSFRPGEGAWVDQLGRVVLADDCLNIPQIPEQPLMIEAGPQRLLCCPVELVAATSSYYSGASVYFDGLSYWCLSTMGFGVTSPGYTTNQQVYRKKCRQCARGAR